MKEINPNLFQLFYSWYTGHLRSHFYFLRTGILISRERSELYERINHRCRAMIQGGIFEETTRVVSEYGENAVGLNSLGYNFALAYINGKMSIESFLEEFSKSHRNYAKKQITWFKKEEVLKQMNWNSALELVKKI